MLVVLFTIALQDTCTGTCTSSLLFILTGMASKAKGQVLRLSALMHLLFNGGPVVNGEDIELIIGEDAVKAAIDFVNVCIQQAAYIAGRGDIEEEISRISSWGGLIICYSSCLIPIYVALIVDCS